jgi:predicted Zn-dependent protease
MSRRKKDVARSKQKKQLRRRNHEKKNHRASLVALPRKLGEQLDDAHDLIRYGKCEEAEQLLQKLDSRGTQYPEVVEALMCLYQETGDHESCCKAAERLTRLRPRDDDARIMFAQESMLCGRAAIALLAYQEFIARWPEHPYVAKARRAMTILVEETDRRIKDFGFPAESGLAWCALHEESLALLHRAEFAGCIAKCKELLGKVPHFASARNNLAIAYFQSGRAKDAVSVVEETRQLLPENRFAEAMLAKLYFLTGRAAEAQQLADRLVANPPTQQDSIVAALEALAFLGRDEDIVRLAEAATDDQVVDAGSRAVRLHFLAYAQCRLGDRKSAKASWKRSLKLRKGLSEAHENVSDLESGEGHSPWGSFFGKWVPKEVMDRVVESIHGEQHVRLSRFPAIAALVPALLDRGDPLGREVALRLSMADQSPPMLDALQDFAFGSRGPDEMRFQALMFLREQGRIDAGPHRIYSRGEWTEIQLLSAEITSEPQPSDSSERVLQLLEDGFYAMRAQDFSAAEAAFTGAIAEEPDNHIAQYNLYAMWIRRDGAAGIRRALPLLKQLHAKHPDYAFAAIAMAQFAADEGDFQRARDLLAPTFQAEKLHISEATALYTAQAQIALAQGDFDAAERAFSLLREISDEDEPNVLAIRYRIDRATKKKGRWRNLFSSVK